MTVLTDEGRAALDRIKAANAMNKEDMALLEAIDRAAPTEVLTENLQIIIKELVNRKMHGVLTLGLTLVKLEIEEILREGKETVAKKIV